MAMENMMAAITPSRTFQKIGRDMNRAADCAPKPIAANQRVLASMAPAENIHRFSLNWLETVPNKITVSR